MENYYTFLNRTNISKKNSKETDTESIRCLYEKDFISINMWKESEEEEVISFKMLCEGEKLKNVKTYIKQYYNLYKLSQEKDILVFAKYKGDFSSKIGLIKKGTPLIMKEKEGRVFYCLKLSEIKLINSYDYPLLETVLPYYGTTSSVIKGREKINSIYSNIPIKLIPENLSDKATEIMCSEWLRSGLCDDKYKVKYQQLLTGGNNSDIDFLGKTVSGKTLITQVTTSGSKKIINSKIEKLEKYKADIKLMFAQNNSYISDSEVVYISIQEVWNDIYQSDFKPLLNFLINE